MTPKQIEQYRGIVEHYKRTGIMDACSARDAIKELVEEVLALKERNRELLEALKRAEKQIVCLTRLAVDMEDENPVDDEMAERFDDAMTWTEECLAHIRAAIAKAKGEK